MHLEPRRDITLPGECLDVYCMAETLAGECNTQHVALQAAVGEILEENECELHRKPVNLFPL